MTTKEGRYLLFAERCAVIDRQKYYNDTDLTYLLSCILPSEK